MRIPIVEAACTLIGVEDLLTFDSSIVLDLSDGNTTVVSSEEGDNNIQSNQSSQLNLLFGRKTKVAVLKYFSERGCIVP